MSQNATYKTTQIQQRLESLIHREADGSITPELVKNLIRQESGWKIDAVSHTGNRGLLQITRVTAHELITKHKVRVEGDILRPENQVKLGVSYLKYLNTRVVDQWPNLTKQQHLGITLHCYNSGFAATKRAITKGGVVDFFKHLPKVNDKNYAAKILNDPNWMHSVQQPRPIPHSHGSYDIVIPLCIVGITLVRSIIRVFWQPIGSLANA